MIPGGGFSKVLTLHDSLQDQDLQAMWPQLVTEAGAPPGWDNPVSAPEAEPAPPLGPGFQ